MYFLAIDAETTEQHPDHARIGEGFVSCWIERESIEEAIATAKALIAEEAWSITRTRLVELVTDADYEEDDDYRQFYEQALIDKEVLVFNSCPRFPVYYLEFAIRRNGQEGGPVKAQAWIVNELVTNEHDPYELDFWSGERVAKAESLAVSAITKQVYAVEEVINKCRCSRDETSEDCQYYDEAEAEGMCLLFS